VHAVLSGGFLFRLDNQIALVTGGASGIGEAICKLFAKAGAEVIIADLNIERASHFASHLHRARPAQVDVTDEASIQDLFSTIAHLDILVNCAGIGLVGTVTETSLEDFRRISSVNVEGTFLTTRASIPFLIQSHGNIINIGSVAGLVGVKRRFAYCASKGAVIAMTRQLAVDFPTQFRANCICPGTVDSPFVEGYLEKYHSHEKEKVRAELHERQPIGRMGRPEEVAALALYLASGEAAFVHGSVLNIDGGWTAA
jgi:NAD(P)-dependent dehydrogenase (short-subunit alcohol dehydrogenase family)